MCLPIYLVYAHSPHRMYLRYAIIRVNNSHSLRRDSTMIRAVATST